MSTKPGHTNRPAAVNPAAGRLAVQARCHGADAPGPDGHVGAEARPAGAVYDLTTGDHHIPRHVIRSPLVRLLRWLRHRWSRPDDAGA